ncbi:MAG: 2-amino-4-hydroxy-6-hydroxymethyldihydropteridine diphosphokinase [Myxococcales bacterium]|nr:2-amino-4-hydroxy-6-hydroxymethyldihydropteridine diphosphokinase [Myxococcales bacterium]MCB9645112.1 2-amino-4-hydroxy-6-hydroxymethyldihydropteridine diphosphokinase [Deltaproteobacteria bacterium]
MVRVFIALGANLGEPRAALAEAQARLRPLGVAPLRRARLYRSAPVGPPGQPPYYNTALEVETALLPDDLLAVLKQIEATMGRTPGERWGPRVIDLDIALYGGLVLDTPELTIPHRELANRAFVLAPLCDLAADLEVPGRGATLAALLEALPRTPGDLEVVEHAVQDVRAAPIPR